ncbi:tRNA (guanine(10)-N(2))-dimethyltransferase [Sulfuracidifex tepidarius]|nr:tRNA (guanine(10)-N(2))-dimethyltransferase [Sulfuracidifex tepidarius]
MKKIEIKEGKAVLHIPDPKEYTVDGKFDPAWSPVFYNPRMKLNRDISVAVAKVFSPKTVIDAFSASGVRGIRYALESGVGHIIFNDVDKNAVDLIKENIELNSIPSYEIYNMEANALLDVKRGVFIDIDPFGSPSPFIQASMRSTGRRGLIGFTATDLSPLEGSSPKACMRKYGATNKRKLSFSKEVGIRILIGRIAKDAAVEEKGIFPVLSFYHGHFFRVFVRVEEGATKADNSLEKMGFVAECERCGYHKFSSDPCDLRRCDYCGCEMNVAGPLWLGQLQDKSLLQQLHLEGEAEKIVSKMRAEATAPPFYYSLDKLSSRLRLSAVPSTSDIVECTSGFYTHFDPKGIKTDLSFEKVIECIKKFVR